MPIAWSILLVAKFVQFLVLWEYDGQNYIVFECFQGEKSNLIEQRKALSAENKEFWSAIDGKRKEMEPLHEALGQLRGSKNAGRERGPMVCSSEEELNQLVRTRL